ncbi:MAG: VUT family protein, partial [Cyclobacteriaceae bacterium]
MSSFDQKKNRLFIILSGIFLTNALLAEMVGTKIFSLEGTLGMKPAQLNIFSDWVLDFNLTAGVVLWPVVFVTTDIINEYFGRSGVKRITFLTVGFIIYSFLIIALVTKLEPAEFWLDVNSKTPEGTPFDINFAFNKVFLQ